jgi:predicted regulator of Ras-like GTPase activity (Roadblock/LC7/MglB family)
MRRLHGHWSFGQPEQERLTGLLQRFLEETGAQAALLVDRAGQLLVSAGTVSFDGLSFASLAAADFEASDQLATLLGEDEFASLYHQGEHGSMYLVDIAGRAILAALFDRRTTLGMVRLKTKVVVPQFAALFDELARGPAPEEQTSIDAGWAEAAEREIDRLFNG